MDNNIEKAILQSQGEIRDRSEFGLKSVIYYLNYLVHTTSEEQVLMAILLELAKAKNIDTEELDRISTIHEGRLRNLRETDVKSEHPRLSELLTIIDNLPTTIQEEYLVRLDEVEFDGIEDLYKEVRDKYFLEGKEPLRIVDRENLVLKKKTN